MKKLSVFCFILLANFVSSALAVPRSAADNLLFAALLQQCAAFQGNENSECLTRLRQCGDSSEWDKEKTTGCFNNNFIEPKLAEREHARKAREDEIAARNRANKERIEQEKQAQENLMNQQREQQRVAAIEQQKEIDRQIKHDEALGYKHITLTDFQLDANTMPLGTKLAISGLYKVDGKIEHLAESLMPDAPAVILITDSAPRPSRKQFLECGRAGTFCTLNVLGHTAKCNVTWLGRHVSTDTCLSVDK